MSETNEQTANLDELSTSASDSTTKALAKRRSRFDSTVAALTYVTSLSRENEVKLRDTDRATTIMLALVCVLTLVSLFVKAFVSHRVNLLIVCDLLFGASLLFYLTNRFGIVSSMPPRQALLTWQLMLCSFLIGSFVTINLLMIVGFSLPNPNVLTAP